MPLINLPDPRQLARFRDVARLLVRHGRRGLVGTAASSALLEESGGDAGVEDGAPEELADDLQALGPTFVKLGQLLSTRPDLLPRPYLEALGRLQDDVAPFEGESVREIVEAELGARLTRAFDDFDLEPWAAASLAQVHRATLRDGTRVAVKVQRPGIRDEVAADLEVLRTIAEWLQEHSASARTLDLAAIRDHFERTLLRELDFRREAAHLDRIRAGLVDTPLLTAPRPILDYTTRRVLTMTFVDGVPLRSASPLALTDVDGRELARQLFRATLHQVLVDGMFHADPHPGNVLLTRDGRLALLDLGMVGHVAADQQGELLRLLMALGERDGRRAADLALSLARPSARADVDAFRRRVADLVLSQTTSTIGRLEAGRILIDVCRAAAATGVRIPPDLAVLAKALLNLDQIGVTLDPGFDPAEEIRAAADELVARRLDRDFTRSGVVSTLLDAKDFAGALPSRLGRILELVAENRLRVEVDALDEDRLVSSFEKIANRISAGLVLSALILGAADLMRVETEWTLLGYPGLALVLFLLAAAGGLRLVWGVVSDGSAPRP